jgi:hypothetical protein
MQAQASALIFKGRITLKTGPAYHGPDIYSARRPIGFRALFLRDNARQPAAECGVYNMWGVKSGRAVRDQISDQPVRDFGGVLNIYHNADLVPVYAGHYLTTA